MNAKKNNFEKKLKELDQIVELMENDTINLNDSFKYYERGVNLIKICMEELKLVEEKVVLLNSNLEKQ